MSNLMYCDYLNKDAKNEQEKKMYLGNCCYYTGERGVQDARGCYYRQRVNMSLRIANMACKTRKLFEILFCNFRR